MGSPSRVLCRTFEDVVVFKGKLYDMLLANIIPEFAARRSVNVRNSSFHSCRSSVIPLRLREKQKIRGFGGYSDFFMRSVQCSKDC